MVNRILILIWQISVCFTRVSRSKLSAGTLEPNTWKVQVKKIFLQKVIKPKTTLNAYNAYLHNYMVKLPLSLFS